MIFALLLVVLLLTSFLPSALAFQGGDKESEDSECTDGESADPRSTDNESTDLGSTDDGCDDDCDSNDDSEGNNAGCADAESTDDGCDDGCDGNNNSNNGNNCKDNDDECTGDNNDGKDDESNVNNNETDDSVADGDETNESEEDVDEGSGGNFEVWAGCENGDSDRTNNGAENCMSVEGTVMLAAASSVSVVAPIMGITTQPTATGHELWNLLPEKLRKLLKLLLRRSPLFFFFGGILERLTSSDVLKNQTRERIYEYITKHPGTHLRGIMQAVNIGPNEAQYHLYVLERFRLVKSERFGKFLVYHHVNGERTATESRIRFALRHRIPQEIVMFLTKHPGAHESKVARALGVYNNTIRYHTNRLKEVGIVDRVKENGHTKLFLSKQFVNYLVPS